MADMQPFESLTSREREILTLLGRNLSDREIAERLFVAYTTVKWFNRQIFKKLGVENRQEAIRQAAASGLLDAPGTPKSAPKHNLPSALTPFIGRSTELTDLQRLIAHPHTRLVTILAPGGMGKTRLALESAAAMLDLYGDGVFFVSLAGLTSSDHFVSATAEALGLQFMSDGREPKQQLSDFLHRKHLLLVLDNFEHLLDSAPLTVEMLTTAPALKIVTTSRERLGVTGEVVYRLAGLQYPPDSAAEPLQFGAVQLFIECALRANPHFGADDAVNMSRICRSAQGMPLAIELAAAWIGALSAGEIAAEIERSADFLQTSMRDVPERLRSIRAVFEAAWARLDENARRAFRRMSMFRGGCTREAAQVVTGASLSTLSALADKALLWRNPHTERYEVHELLRQYAEGELEKAGETESARQAHQEYYARLSQTWGIALMSGKEQESLSILGADFDNIRLALTHASARGIASEIEPFTDLTWFYDLRGLWNEMLTAFQAAIDRLEPHDSVALGRLLTGQVVCYVRFKIKEPLGEVSQRSIAMFQRLGERAALPLAMMAYKIHLEYIGQWQEGESVLHEALAIARETGNAYMVAGLIHHLGGTARILRNDYEEAKSKHTEALRLFSELGSRQGMSHTLMSLGYIAIDLGEYEEAERHFSEMLRLAREIGFLLMIDQALLGFSLVRRKQRNWQMMRPLLVDMLRLRHSLGFPDHEIRVFVTLLAETNLMLNELDDTRRYLRESVPLLADWSVRSDYWLMIAAGYVLRTGQFARAAAILSSLGPVDLIDMENMLLTEFNAECRAALTPEEFAAAVESGKTLTPEAAVAELMPFL